MQVRSVKAFPRESAVPAGLLLAVTPGGTGCSAKCPPSWMRKEQEDVASSTDALLETLLRGVSVHQREHLPPASIPPRVFDVRVRSLSPPADRSELSGGLTPAAALWAWARLSGTPVDKAAGVSSMLVAHLF